MGRFLGDLIGTLRSTFKIGRSNLDASGLSAPRNLVLPNYNLTLKTAAGADLQTSTSDTTTGRALANGAYGWGGTAPVLAGNDYNNSSEYSGLVRNNNSVAAVNYPPQFGASNQPFAVLNARFNSSYGWQFGVRTTGVSPTDATLNACFRAEVAGIWGNWAELWHSLNLKKQTSPSDATAGYVLTVGAGGLLGTSEDLGSGFDWNNLGGPSRLVRGALNSTVNGPSADAVWLTGLYIALDPSGNNGVFHGSVVSNTTVRHFSRSKAGGTWYGWAEEWHSGNFNPASKQDALGYTPVNKAGDSMTGILRGTSPGDMADATGSKAQFEVFSASSDAAFMSFHRAGAYGTYLGLGTDNNLRVGGWSMGAVSYKLLHEGNFDATDSDWIALTLTNGWSNQGSFGTPAYRRIGKVVYLRGVVTAALANNNKVGFTLPAGYRPAALTHFSNGGGSFLVSNGVVSIATNGQATLVDAAGGSTCLVSLYGASFVVA